MQQARNLREKKGEALDLCLPHKVIQPRPTPAHLGFTATAARGHNEGCMRPTSQPPEQQKENAPFGEDALANPWCCYTRFLPDMVSTEQGEGAATIPDGISSLLAQQTMDGRATLPVPLRRKGGLLPVFKVVLHPNPAFVPEVRNSTYSCSTLELLASNNLLVTKSISRSLSPVYLFATKQKQETSLETGGCRGSQSRLA